jgi:hypothetical protein
MEQYSARLLDGTDVVASTVPIFVRLSLFLEPNPNSLCEGCTLIDLQR